MQLLLTPDTTDCVKALSSTIRDALASGQRVLWFMTGGSNIAVDIKVMAGLDEVATERLTVTLTDERYGDYGHADSNWQQLLAAGLDTKRATVIEVLQADNPSLEQTTAIFASNLDRALSEAGHIIGFYGLGTDGHIAGILPDTPAIDANGLATGYVTDTYTRITTTFDTIRRCDVAYMDARGELKQEPLMNLTVDLPIAEQPAQVLKQLSEAYIYNDQTGETV